MNQFAPWTLFGLLAHVVMAARLLPQGKITADMLRSLIESKIAEGQAIEFKRLIDITDANSKKSYPRKLRHSQMRLVATSFSASMKKRARPAN
jgi:hypothetical protein